MSGPIILDCDGVLLNWTDGIRKYLEGQGIKTNGPTPTNYGLNGWVDGLTKNDLVRHIIEFNEGSDTGFGALQPYPGAVSAVQQLAASGRDVHVLTAASDKVEVQERRIHNLVSVFGDIFTDITCIAMTRSKELHLRAFDQGDFVEDHPGNALLGESCGHRAHLILQPTNSHEDVAGSQVQIHENLTQAVSGILMREVVPGL